MSLVLHIDSAAWRGHLMQVAARHPGVVPVIKGNGYGFGNTKLADVAAEMGADTIAVGNPTELAQMGPFPGAVLMLSPWHPATASGRYGDEIHTIASLEALGALRDGMKGPNWIVLELRTEMDRFGIDDFAAARDLSRGLNVVGLSIHPPLTETGAAAAVETVTAAVRAGLPAEVVYASHLQPEQAQRLAGAIGIPVRSKIGTRLWLDNDALSVTSTVLDVHRTRASRVGYRGVKARGGTIAVVSGGVAHGIGLDSPRVGAGFAASTREVAKASARAVGRIRSPFYLGETQLEFVEPPDSQVSMVWVPSGQAAPAVGDSLAVRVRFLALRADYFVER